MASIQWICPDCGAAIDMSVGQYVYNNELSWYGAYRCGRCGNAVEIDGDANTPEDVRQAILREEGTWELVVSETGQRRLLVLKVLRGVFSLSLADVAQLRNHLPGAISTGTHAEMLWLQSLLAAEGLKEVTVRRVHGASHERGVPLDITKSYH